MSLKNCIECGKLFLDNPSGVCPACYREVEKAEALVGEFLRTVQKKASIEEISRETGVKHKVILRMLKQGRVLSDFPITYPCESCGALIEEGRLCSACSKNIVDQLKPEPEPELTKAKQSEGMYTKEFFRK